MTPYPQRVAQAMLSLGGKEGCLTSALLNYSAEAPASAPTVGEAVLAIALISRPDMGRVAALGAARLLREQVENTLASEPHYADADAVALAAMRVLTVRALLAYEASFA